MRDSSCQHPGAEGTRVSEALPTHTRPAQTGILTISVSEPKEAWRLRLEAQLRSEAWLLMEGCVEQELVYRRGCWPDTPSSTPRQGRYWAMAILQGQCTCLGPAEGHAEPSRMDRGARVGQGSETGAVRTERH